MSKGQTTVLLILCLLVVAVGHETRHHFFRLPLFSKSEPPQVRLERESSPQIVAQGRLEPVSGTITVSAIPGEQVVELKAYVGQQVKKEDTLAVLGSRVIRQAERKLAEEQLKKAEKELEFERQMAQKRTRAALVSARQVSLKEKEIPVQESAIEIGRKRLKLAENQLERLDKLRKNPATDAGDAISDTEYKQQVLLVQQIEAEIAQNSAKLQAARDSLDLAKEAAQIDNEMASLAAENLKHANTDVLKQTVSVAKLAEGTSEIKAPISGTILEVYTRQGERITNTPILQMGDLSKMVCIAEVHEARLGDIQVKRIAEDATDRRRVPAREYRAEITSPALATALKGRVVAVGRLIGAPALRDPNPLARTDLRTAKVRIELDDESTRIARNFVHLQVNIAIDLGQGEKNK